MPDFQKSPSWAFKHTGKDEGTALWGSFDIQSAMDRGTTATLTLPLNKRKGHGQDYAPHTGREEFVQRFRSPSPELRFWFLQKAKV